MAWGATLSKYCNDRLGKGPTVKTGKKWNPLEAVQHAQVAQLQHRDVIGRYRVDKQGSGLADCWKAWGKATLLECRRMDSSFVHQQEEETRQAAAASQAKQGMNWRGVEMKWVMVSGGHQAHTHRTGK